MYLAADIYLIYSIRLISFKVYIWISLLLLEKKVSHIVHTSIYFFFLYSELKYPFGVDSKELYREN